MKEIGFRGIQRQLKENLLDTTKKENFIREGNKNVSIKILMKNKEVYKFYKENPKRTYFILERLFFAKKEILSDLIIEYENYKREKKKINS
ncbi:plasmid partition family protein [Borreliella lusitaniae]|uniref:plasmid partition family protein n=1 Tax=Borreliella lusitaniae TaxID=100177 RepID=UPI003C7180C0